MWNMKFQFLTEYTTHVSHHNTTLVKMRILPFKFLSVRFRINTKRQGVIEQTVEPKDQGILICCKVLLISSLALTRQCSLCNKING